MSEDKEDVVSKTQKTIEWWVAERKKKLVNQLSETMSLNPFLTPFLFEYHNLVSIGDIVDLLVASHLITGHNTGFGKLVDEKILPNVFGCVKLDKKFRENTAPYGESCFDEIDHIVKRDGASHDLLSLKAGKWTIQLTMAVQLNRSFSEILKLYPTGIQEIAVGVFYGDRKGLTDKYDILQGINRGANHDVVDLTAKVSVYAGREFWSWINDGVPETQEWVMEGIVKGIEDSKIRNESEALMTDFNLKIERTFEDCLCADGKMDWYKLLAKING